MRILFNGVQLGKGCQQKPPDHQLEGPEGIVCRRQSRNGAGPNHGHSGEMTPPGSSTILGSRPQSESPGLWEDNSLLARLLGAFCGGI